MDIILVPEYLSISGMKYKNFIELLEKLLTLENTSINNLQVYLPDYKHIQEYNFNLKVNIIADVNFDINAVYFYFKIILLIQNLAINKRIPYNIHTDINTLNRYLYDLLEPLRTSIDFDFIKDFKV